jgi:hypothetical protein
MQTPFMYFLVPIELLIQTYQNNSSKIYFWILAPNPFLLGGNNCLTAFIDPR